MATDTMLNHEIEEYKTLKERIKYGKTELCKMYSKLHNKRYMESLNDTENANFHNKMASIRSTINFMCEELDRTKDLLEGWDVDINKLYIKEK